MSKISYDRLEDVLYVSFTDPSQKAIGEMYGNFIIRTNKNGIVGVTILDASIYLKIVALEQVKKGERERKRGKVKRGTKRGVNLLKNPRGVKA